MTQDEIIAMLRASCDKDKVDPEQNGFWVIVTEELVRFANLVAQHEREACAKVCDVLAYHPEFASDATKLAAMAIRARGQV
jgi:hypothetical protein